MNADEAYQQEQEHQQWLELTSKKSGEKHVPKSNTTAIEVKTMCIWPQRIRKDHGRSSASGVNQR